LFVSITVKLGHPLDSNKSVKTWKSEQQTAAQKIDKQKP